MKQIIVDDITASEVDLNGFAKIPVLNHQELTSLIDFYYSQQNDSQNDYGFEVSIESLDLEYKKIIGNKIDTILKRSKSSLFKNAHFISPRFVLKKSNPNSFVPPHQDWTFVDEKKYRSYNLWIALVDTTIENGALGFVPKTHNYFTTPRATPLPIFKVPFEDNANAFLPYTQFIQLKAGEAVLFDSRVVHTSLPNSSGKDRLAIALEITPEEAQLFHFNLIDAETGIVKKYEIDESFFYKYGNAQLLKLFHKKQSIESYPMVGEKNILNIQLSSDEIVKISENQLSLSIIDENIQYLHSISNNIDLSFLKPDTDNTSSKVINFFKKCFKHEW